MSNYGNRREYEYGYPPRYGGGYRRGGYRSYGPRFERLPKERTDEIVAEVKKMMAENISPLMIGSLKDWLTRTYPDNMNERRYAVGCVGGALKEMLREKMGFVQREPERQTTPSTQTQK